MIVHEQKKTIFTNTCGCIVDEELLECAAIWYSDRPMARCKKIYMYGRYPAISIHDKKIHVHRLLMLYRFGNKTAVGRACHHKDGNRLNCLSENICVMDHAKHASLHNKGKTLTPEHRRKIGDGNRRRKGIKYKTKPIHEEKP